MRRWRLTDHLLNEAARRQIDLEQIELTLQAPEQVVSGHAGRMVYQRRFIYETGPALMRVVVEDEEDGVAAVTAYATSKIAKYWST